MYAETLATAEGATVLPLETDLQATRDRLQSTTEQLESSNEHGNEELSSINEELQSANEKWETSREELRSTNEELQTVNSELKTRVDELSCANSDLVNLLECTQIAMFVADRDFALKSFTTAAKDLVARMRGRTRMLPKNLGKRLRERLVPFMRAAALPAALCAPWYTACAQAQEAQNPPASSSPASVADEALVSDLPANLERLPAPAIAPPVNRKKPAAVHVELAARPVTGLLADGIGYHYWTYNGTVPGPMIRVSQGDTVELTLHNALDSPVSHSIDSHGVLGPGGGGKVTQTPPGATSVFQFKAMRPGVFIYHCATPMIPYHLSHGMYGLMVVEPPGGWPKVDKEFYVMEGDVYLKGDRTQSGVHEAAVDKMVNETPDFVVFNGSAGSLSKERALKAKVGETVRIFFGNAGPNAVSSFHVIGEIFDKVHPEGASETLSNVQSTLVPAGGATMVEFKTQVPGTYILVDHSLGRLQKGAAGFLEVEGPPNPKIFQSVQQGSQDGGGH